MAGGIGIEQWRGEKPLEGLRAVRRGEESSIRAARPPGAAGATGKRPGGEGGYAANSGPPNDRGNSTTTPTPRVSRWACSGRVQSWLR